MKDVSNTPFFVLTVPHSKAYAKGAVEDLGNGSYRATVTPMVAGPYHVSVALNEQVLLRCTQLRQGVCWRDVVLSCFFQGGISLPKPALGGACGGLNPHHARPTPDFLSCPLVQC